MTERRDIGGSRARAAVHYAGHLLVARELRCTTKRLGKCVGVTSAMALYQASAFPSSGSDAMGLVLRTDGSGSAPFDQAGSMIYRARVSSVAGR